MSKLRTLLLWRILAMAFAFTGNLHAHNNNNAVDDDCVWEGSSMALNDATDTPSVMNVQAECSAGELKWRHPYGGLRIAFHPRDVKGPFKLCFKAKHPTIAIYNEGFKDLKLLQSVNDKPNKRICVRSSKAHVVLYLESPRKDAKTMKLRYTVEPIRKRGHRIPKACKPCSVLKLIRTICTSDFVVKGHIDSTYAVSDSHDMQANVIAKNIIHQHQTIFVHPKPNASYYQASIRVPKGCNWKKKKQRSYWITGKVVSGKGAVMDCYVKDEASLRSLATLYKWRCGSGR